MQKLKGHFRQLTNALRYLARGDFSGLARRLKWYREEHKHVKLRRRLVSDQGRTWGILCTPHTFFIANAISERLAKHGIGSEIMAGSPDDFNYAFYIVLCPQMFKTLPPADKRVVFQLEQSISSRWFTDDYIKILFDSVATIDYSLVNIEHLATKGVRYPKVHYIPIGAIDSAIGEEMPHRYDFVFYGDSLSCERRRSFLTQLKKKYKVKVCNDIFGDEMYSIIRQAKAVINIHYYEGALLETPRISECISLGIPVLSEGSRDQGEYPEFEGAVRFFDEGSVESMMSAAAEMLVDIEAISKTVRGAITKSASRFNFMLDRFLVALGAIPIDAILRNSPYIVQPSSFFALSLPEAIERRKTIGRVLPERFQLFDGIRHSSGWIGCGGSFKALSGYAHSNGLKRLAVIEDDIILPDDFNDLLREVDQYLDSREAHWDLFSGLMADVSSSAKVYSVETLGSRTYVTIDKMTSMVFNIYNESALVILSEWDANNADASTNTIDRYLERQDDLRVVVCLPFLVGYDEEATSTLWGFNNSRYIPMIRKAEKRIELLAKDWLHERKRIVN
ncbi:methyltransferase type 11 [Brucella sp. RRSP16]|uniref:methyltransferase type 11 n=1 Tax=Brucella sp. RRSP16 TaxID=3453707 RepID=UPI003FCC3626